MHFRVFCILFLNAALPFFCNIPALRGLVDGSVEVWKEIRDHWAGVFIPI